MFDQTFWVALAFVMFIAVVYKPVSRKMAAALDARAEKIKQELDEAVRLREEAQALLAGYERRQNEALKEAEDILGHAREEAERPIEGDELLQEAAAGEVIQGWCLPIARGMKIKHMAGLILPYPTLGEVNKRAAGSYFMPQLFSDRTRWIVRLLARLG